MPPINRTAIERMSVFSVFASFLTPIKYYYFLKTEGAATSHGRPLTITENVFE
jgi:hypothetical protein